MLRLTTRSKSSSVTCMVGYVNQWIEPGGVTQQPCLVHVSSTSVIDHDIQLAVHVEDLSEEGFPIVSFCDVGQVELAAKLFCYPRAIILG